MNRTGGRWQRSCRGRRRRIRRVRHRCGVRGDCRVSGRRPRLDDRDSPCTRGDTDHRDDRQLDVSASPGRHPGSIEATVSTATLPGKIFGDGSRTLAGLADLAAKPNTWNSPSV